MIELDDFLTKKENLMRLEVNDYFQVQDDLERNWRQAVNNFYKDIRRDKVFSVRKKNGLIRIIRTQ